MIFFRTTLLAAIAALAITDVAGVALNTLAACQKPHNEGHKEGHTCSYLNGPSDTQSGVINGVCQKGDEGLYCKAGHEL